MISNNNSNDDRELSCHWLPCSIDHDGHAPVDMFFRPEILEHDHGVSNNEGSDSAMKPPQTMGIISTDQTMESNTTVASFRGRGLMSQVPQSLPAHISGTVLMLDDAGGVNNCDYDGNVSFGGMFGKVHEWEHEHDESNMRMEGAGGVAGAIELLQVLNAVCYYQFFGSMNRLI